MFNSSTSSSEETLAQVKTLVGEDRQTWIDTIADEVEISLGSNFRVA